MRIRILLVSAALVSGACSGVTVVGAATPPANLTFAATSGAEIVYVEVFCYAANPDGVSYSGTITVP